METRADATLAGGVLGAAHLVSVCADRSKHLLGSVLAVRTCLERAHLMERTWWEKIGVLGKGTGGSVLGGRTWLVHLVEALCELGERTWWEYLLGSP